MVCKYNSSFSELSIDEMNEIEGGFVARPLLATKVIDLRSIVVRMVLKAYGIG